MSRINVVSVVEQQGARVGACRSHAHSVTIDVTQPSLAFTSSCGFNNMAKISELPLANLLADTDEFSVVQDGITRRASFAAFTAGMLPLLPDGVQGHPAPVGNVAANLVQLKAAPLTNKTMLFDGVPFTWETSNAPYTPDEGQPVVSTVESDHQPASVGAWVRQRFDSFTRRTVAQLLASTETARGAGATWYANQFSYTEAASRATDHHLTTAGGVKLYVDLPAGGRVDITAFGCVLDGTTDSTAAFQAAFDSDLPLSSGKGTLRLTDTILLKPGADFVGAGGTANYDASPVKIRFEPATKRGVFRWRTEPTAYVFSGARIEGFCLAGYGPGAGKVLDLPFLSNGYLNFFCYTGFDVWLDIRRWLSTKVFGGAQGFRVHGIGFSGAGIDPSDVTTTLTIDAYVSQGPIAYYAASRAVTDCKVTGTIESVDKACDIARGNVTTFNVYTENVPRTDAGSAWVYGKTGSAPAWQTALTVNLQPGVGHMGTLNNANAFDVDHVRLLKISGYIYMYKSLLKTTANTARVILLGLDSASINTLSVDGGIADYGVITMAGFKPEYMKLTPSSEGFFDGAMVSPTLKLWPRERANVQDDRLFLDRTLGGKLVYRDEHGNFTAPIGALRVSGTSNWTVQGGRLAPGELVQNAAVTRGEPGLWVSTRFSKDVGNNYPGCSTKAGSPIITHPTVGAFFKCEVGDYVVVSEGFGDAGAQRRVIDRMPDLTSITLESKATSTNAAVMVATEPHRLVPLAQQGAREVGVNPIGAVVPYFRGEELFRTDTSNWYKSTGMTAADWKLMTGAP